MVALARWWDSTELWLTGLPYVAQSALVLVALVLIAILVVRVLAALIDRVGDWLQARFGRAAGADAAGPEPGEGKEHGV